MAVSGVYANIVARGVANTTISVLIKNPSAIPSFEPYWCVLDRYSPFLAP